MLNPAKPYKARRAAAAWGEGAGHTSTSFSGTTSSKYLRETPVLNPPTTPPPIASTRTLDSARPKMTSITSAELENSPVAAKPPATLLTLQASSVTTKALHARDLAAPNFGNDYSNYFVHHGTLPQSWVQDIAQPFHEYPKLQRLHDIKEKHYSVHASPPISIRCPTPSIPHLVEQFSADGAQFDVVMVNGCVNHFSMAELEALKIDSITPRPSLLYLWVQSACIREGRLLMEKWGFRHGEDVTYMVRSLDSAHLPGFNPWKPEDTSLFTQTTWHCLMGLKGTLRRSTDTALINCNVDTDVIVELPGQRKNIVPEQIYTLIENFTSMKRKLHIVPSRTTESLPVRPRKGWVVVAPDTFSVGDFKAENFKHRTLIPVNPEVNILRPRTPPNHR